jgi:enterochelin esterase-like enzyme
MQLIKKFIVSFILLGLSACSHFIEKEADLNVVCKEMNGEVSWKYCLSRTPQSNNEELVYFFHEGGGDEHSWSAPNNLGRAIRDEWRKHKNSRPPIVVSISFGQNWFLTRGKPKKENDLQYGLQEPFLNEIIPLIEHDILVAPPTSRHLIGISMGAFNAGQLAFQGNFTFSSVSLICPALSIPKRKANESFKALAVRVEGEEAYVKKLLEISKVIFDDEKSLQEHSVLNLAKQNEPNSKKFYISSSRDDEFGFYHPAVKLHTILQKKEGVSSVFKQVDGGHCNMDPVSLAKFLLTNQKGLSGK